MSIIIQFNSSPFIQSSGAVPSNAPCRSKTTVKLEMVPGIDHSDLPGMTDDESSIVDIATPNSVYATTLKDVKTSNCCFGLPYQDHNYGAPPPPTPPSYSPCPSPAVDVAIPDDDTNLSIISTTTTTEEALEESVTRCICGFEHDDEYMICCDHCLVWQHVDCMGLDRNNIPETYLCEKCEPRKLDKHKAKLLQARKKVALTKLPPTKQESSANNLIFGKNYKKKTLLQSPDEWHKTDYQVMPAVSLVQRFYGTSDSDEDNKNTERRPKTRSKRRKREEEKLEQSSKKSKSLSKHGKDRMEVKRSKFRRNKNKESTSTADEEAQDAWEYSTEWCEENFEAAINNQYTPEVQHLARLLSIQGFEKKFFEQIQTKQCHVLDDGKRKQLVCLYDLPRNQPLIEYKGKFLLASQFHDIHPLYNKRLYPYVLFYKLDQTEICVDASIYGNDARFVRRSCKPNAEIRHMTYNGNLHLYLQSTKVIFSEDEVTVPLNFNQCDSVKEVECACGTDDCLLKPKKKNGGVEVIHERRRSRRSTVSADDENSQSTSVVQAEKTKNFPAKIQSPELPVPPPEPNEPVIDVKPSPSDHETEEHATECKKKLTREERKIDAYVRAFNRLEKAERRKQQKEALERQKAQQPKSEEPTEKSEIVISSVKEEEKPAITSVTEVQGEEDVKVEVKAPVPTPKAKKGKRRRGSGTPSRRRTRTNSGGSDILGLEEVLQKVAVEQPPVVPATTITASETIVQPVSAPVITSEVPDSPTPVPPIESPKILKTKRLLLREWLQEKSESAENATVTYRSIHTEMKWNMSAAAATCYVRCTKDTPHSGGISAAHLRRSNSSGHIKASGGQGSAKKRWLRQAMHDCESCEEQLKIDSSSLEHLDSVCLSPNCHGDVDSPGTAADGDILTPLKKRRLLRESIESLLPFPHSPSVENCMDDTDATTSSSLPNDMSTDNQTDVMDQQLLCATTDDSVHLSPKTKEHFLEVNNFKMEEISTKGTDVKNEILCDDLGTPVIDENNSHENPSVSDESKLLKAPESSVQIDCDLTSDIKDIKSHTSFKKDFIESSSSMEIDSIDMAESVNSENHRSTPSEKVTSSNFKTDDILVKSDKQSPVKVEGAESTIKEDSLAQKQLLNSTAVIVSQSVHNTSPVKITCTSPVRDILTSPSHVKVEAPENTEHILSRTNHESEASTTKSSVQDKTGTISPCKDSILDDNSVTETLLTVNKEEDNSTNDRPSDLSVTFEQAVCSNSSSCSNVESSVVGSSQSSDSIVQSRCTANEEPSPVKNCASATQKRKVSLSEYRMRMRENNSKPRSNSDAEKKSADISVNSTVKPEILPAKVTLAPLPLFDTSDNSLNQTNKQVGKKKKEAVVNEDNQDTVEHRENLNERLKREFGFDFSEGSSHTMMKSKCNNQTSSNSTISKLPPPPPPPPPRPLRTPQTTAIGGVTAPLSSQFGFVHPSFPRPPYILPPQVPGPPYITTQPAMVAPIMPPPPMSPNPTVRPPLLPTTHSFAPSIPTSILRTPARHEYAPVNAQRFVAMVPQPPMTHKAYPHVYSSGLYK